MKPILAVLLAAGLLLAGCASKDPGSTSSSTKTTGGGSGGGGSGGGGTTTSPGPGGGQHNSTHVQAPVIHSFAAERANATTLRFNFTFEATDPAGLALTWTLDPSGNGTLSQTGHTLPGKAVVTYPAAGLYNATLTVSNGSNSTRQVLAVNASLAPLGPLMQATATWKVGTAACLAYPYVGIGTGEAAQPSTPYSYGGPDAGILYAELALPAKAPSHEYTADFGASGSPADGVQVNFYGADGSFVGQGYAGFPNDVPAGATLVVKDRVPAGAAYAQFSNCGNPQGVTVTMTVV